MDDYKYMGKFSIILPVRNGGEYVKHCIKSILAQHLNDFNLIILDNSSTDGTTEWMRSLSDHRIVIHPSEKPLTIEENWRRVLDVPKNEFMTLIGHDDILFPGYLTEINELIQKHPDASLYQTHFTYIDNKGAKMRSCRKMEEIEDGPAFLSTFLQNKVDVMGTGFMMRSREYDRLGGIPPYPNLLFADFEIWLKLTAINFKATSPKECFSFRIHQGTTTISPDMKFHLAFERFIYFLVSLKQDIIYRNVIEKYSIQFIRKYCKSLAHRLLRTPKHIRNGLTVQLFLNKCKMYADLLVPANDFNPTSDKSVLLAQMLDSNWLGRTLFLLFKKIYSKPVLR